MCHRIRPVDVVNAGIGGKLDDIHTGRLHGAVRQVGVAAGCIGIGARFTQGTALRAADLECFILSEQCGFDRPLGAGVSLSPFRHSFNVVGILQVMLGREYEGMSIALVVIPQILPASRTGRAGPAPTVHPAQIRLTRIAHLLAEGDGGGCEER